MEFKYIPEIKCHRNQRIYRVFCGYFIFGEWIPEMVFLRLQDGFVILKGVDVDVIIRLEWSV